jgi:hypothetical protein
MASDPGGPEVSVGRVFSRAFGTIGSNPAATLGIGFLFGGFPTVLLAYLVQTYGGQAPDLLGVLGETAVDLAMPAATIALSTITQGALVRATVLHGEGQASSLGESAAPALALTWPLFMMAILSGAAIGLGLLFLIVPGVLLYLIWSVAGPALVEERLGPLQALRRSRDLTRGTRWKVFAVVLVSMIASMLATSVMEMINIALFDKPGNLMEPLGPDPRLPFLFYTANAIFQTLSMAVWGVILASLYVELREWKDGPRTDGLAEIFA